MTNEKRFNTIVGNIKRVKIQGARNIAKAALCAYSLRPTSDSRKKLISARPTEPMLVNTLNNLKTMNHDEILGHFNYAQDKINKNVLKLIKNNSVIFTHCHSSNVVLALIYAKQHGKMFEVYNTETRPFFQGRKTAKELNKFGIKVTMFLDSEIDIALEGKQDCRKVGLILLGADAIVKDNVINKVGSGMIAELAHFHKIPLYIVADSWKYSARNVKIEERDFREAWGRVPEHVKFRNIAFEKIPKKYIKNIVSELGILSYDKFLSSVRHL
jgi:ribose 1,5-bisphosphate isomerase